MLSLLADYGYQVHHYWLFIILGVLVLNSIPVVIAICGCITNRNRSETMQDRVNIPCHLPRILFCLCRQYFTCLNFFFFINHLNWIKYIYFYYLCKSTAVKCQNLFLAYYRFKRDDSNTSKSFSPVNHMYPFKTRQFNVRNLIQELNETVI